MNSLMSAFHGWSSLVEAPLGMLLAKVTALLAAAWFAYAVLGRVNPRWRVLLWRVTATSLVLLPLLPLLVPAWSIEVPRPATGAASIAPVVLAQGSLPVAVAPPVAPMESHVTQPSAPALAQGPALPAWFTWPRMLVTAWLVGLAMLALRVLLGYGRIAQLVAQAAAVPERVQREAERVAEALGCRRAVVVLQSQQVASPILCGLWQPKILLPARMCDASYATDLPGIFAHELMHLRSRDLVWNAGLELLSLVLWFHPLAWRMRRAHLAACELVCDAISVQLLGDVSGYCRTLARVAIESHGVLPAAGIAMARTSSVRRRLNALKSGLLSLPLRRRSVLGFGLVMVLAVTGLGALRLALAEPATPTQTATAAAGVMRVQVLDPEGKPLEEARIHASIWTKEKSFRHNRDYQTDTAGIAPVELPPSYEIVRLWTGKRGMSTLFSHWEQNELASGTKLPAVYTVQLEASVSAGGRIVDEQGQPIAGVTVEVEAQGGHPAKADGRTGYAYGVASGKSTEGLDDGAVTTDAEGRWRIDNVPCHPKTTLTLMVTHPDYISDLQGNELQKAAGITTAMLRQQTAVLTLKSGIRVHGQVTDPEGHPLPDALVIRGDDPYLSRTPAKFATDAEGRFRWPALPPGEVTLTVLAPGFAPQMRQVQVAAGMAAHDFRMQPGKPIELRFVDPAGQPIPEVSVRLLEWKGKKSIQSDHNPNHPKVPDVKIPKRADAEGAWRWDAAPDEPVKMLIEAKGCTRCELEMAGGEPPRTVTLKLEHRITGRVTDAQTGQPLPTFTVLPVNIVRSDWLSAERYNAVPGKDGQFAYLARGTDCPQRLRVEALGYRTQTGPEFRVGDDSPRSQDFPLQPSPPITGVILHPTGNPAGKVNVLLAIPTEQVALGGVELANHVVVTDEAGHFAFPDPGEPFTVVAQGEAGFALADFAAERHELGSLQLKPWASVRGQFRDGGQPIPNATFFVALLRPLGTQDPRIDTQMLQVRTDQDGRFEFPRLPPEPLRMWGYLGPWHEEGFRSAPSIPLDLQPGQQVELDLGHAGAVIDGQVTLTGNVPAELDCTYSLNYLIQRKPAVPPSPEMAQQEPEAREGWQPRWCQTGEGSPPLNTHPHWFVKLAADGSFRISGVPEGQYDLTIAVYAKPSGCLVEPLGRAVVPVTVRAEDVARGQLTVPAIPVPLIPLPAVGETPKLRFQGADGQPGSLTEFRGQYTLVHFWASWCSPCRTQLPQVRRLQERYAPRLTVVGISLDEESATWQAACEQLHLTGPQGRLTAAAEAGISTVPTYWLLDPAGKLLARTQDPEALAEPLAQSLEAR